MSKPTPKRCITSLDDLVQLPDVELDGCLRALRLAVRAHKKNHHDAVRAGAIRSDADNPLTEVTWTPRQARVKVAAEVFVRTAPIEALPLRLGARIKLRELKVFCLEDLSAISEGELLACKHIGRTTVARMRDWLNAVGLGFSEHPSPVKAAHETSRAILRLPEAERRLALAGLTDDVPIERLGLRGLTLKKAALLGINTIGQVRGATLELLRSEFGRSGTREILAALQLTGSGLKCQSATFALWRYGLIKVEDMAPPSDEATRIAELAPWIGGIAARLSQHGIGTLGELTALARSGGLAEVPGIGPTTRMRILEHLGLRKKSAESNPGRPATSVFDLAR